MIDIDFVVNGQAHVVSVEPRTLLVTTLRETLTLTGTKVGCETGVCGACTVLLDDDPIKSCTIFAVQADGREVTTIEGLTPPSGLSDVQEAFKAEHGLQCGFCTPGMVVAATALLDSEPNPSDEQIREGLDGNLCRCTGYVGIIRAVRLAAGLRAGEEPAAEAGRRLAEPLARREVDRVDVDTERFEVI